MSNVGIHFGAMCKPIEQQLQEQGFTLSVNEGLIQRAADSITFLYIHSYLTKAQADSARKKLFKKIDSTVKKLT